MCGICGFISDKPITRDSLIKMNNTISHRGPDDHGEEIYQTGANRYVGFAHRRLSIIDLSDNGHQPMHSADRRISVVFNGEIYNFKELKEELKGYCFQSNSDTEVIIASYLKWGIDFVDKLNGMYAIALLDRMTDTVYLIRDRIGKKPLYYYMKENNIVFGSELKAVAACPLVEKELNKEIIGRFLHKQYITAPDTIYQNIYKLEPGSIVTIKAGAVKKKKYWDISQKYKELRNAGSICSYEEVLAQFENLISSAVARRLYADVPIGAFLSGGYDSTLVCAIAQNMISKPLKTFTIGFHEHQYNEAEYARLVADYLGTEHVELYISENEMLDLLKSVPIYYDEPFADASQIPTMLVSELSKRSVSVILSGDGGDELFGGYNIYTYLQKAQLLLKYGTGNISVEQEWLKNPLEYRIVTDNRVDDRARTQAGSSNYVDCIDKLLLNPVENYFYEFEDKYGEDRLDVTRMLLDMETFLPEDILTKVDRASMKYALECRCPLLDKNILEFSLGIPWNYKNDNGNQKQIIKDVVYKYIPKEIMERPKMGFAVPLDKWLRGALREQLLEWTNRDFLVRQGIFDPDTMTEFIDNYMKNGDKGKWSGENYSKIVWPYFVFQQWYISQWMRECYD